jgi:hypothetical protein
MGHQRSAIRDAVVTAVGGLATTGTNVFASRVRPMTASELPCLCVYVREDDSEEDEASMSADDPPRILMRRAEVHVEGYVRGSDDDTLDDIAEEVETALFSDTALLAEVNDWRQGPQTLRVDGEGDNLIGAIDMTFFAFYRVQEGVPGTLL